MRKQAEDPEKKSRQQLITSGIAPNDNDSDNARQRGERNQSDVTSKIGFSGAHDVFETVGSTRSRLC